MKLKRISIEKAENGFEICASFEKPPEKGKKSEMCCPSWEEKRFVASNTVELLKMVSEIVKKSPASDAADYLFMDESEMDDSEE